MSRPMKGRNVCALPQMNHFIPQSESITSDDVIIMSVDEYETLRLIDHEGLTQEECANQMNIARTTVTSIYASARKKTAQFFVEARPLAIQGGRYHLCDGLGPHCRKQTCHRGRKNQHRGRMNNG